MNTMIYCLGYDRDFISRNRTGWGCGYIMIPLDHPFLIAAASDNEKRKANDKDYYDWGYIQILEFSEEITLCEDDELEGIKYKRLGFDTAHLWNNIEKNPRDFVLAKTFEMQRIIESYK